MTIYSIIRRCTIPIYEFSCNECNHQFDVFTKTFSLKESSVICEQCGKKSCKKQISVPQVKIGENKPDRYERAEKSHMSKVKDPERARRMRKKKFGTEGISITKSPYYHKEKRVKAQGTSQEVDKKTFIQAAAKNPNALKAAVDVVNKKK